MKDFLINSFWEDKDDFKEWCEEYSLQLDIAIIFIPFCIASFLFVLLSL